VEIFTLWPRGLDKPPYPGEVKSAAFIRLQIAVIWASWVAPLPHTRQL